MDDAGINEMEITEAKRITGEPFFYCTKYKNVFQLKTASYVWQIHFISVLIAMSEVGDTCSRLWCADYSPRNGKNGRCRYSGYCYEKTDVKRIIKIK